MSDEVVTFQQTINIEFQKLSDLVKESNFKIKDQEMRQDSFEIKHTRFDELLSLRKSECDSLE
jgi:ABC-type lipoprotein export system ATPase subunit